MHSYFRFCFRHVLTYSSIIQEHTHAYSEPSVSLAYSKPWHISIIKHIQTLRYIHNTILNIFTKAQSCTFDTVLNAPVFYRCYLTSRVTLRHLWGYISDIFRHIQDLFSHIYSCLGILRALPYLGHSASAILRHTLNATQYLGTAGLIHVY